MKATLEKIDAGLDRSFSVKKFTEENVNRVPFWHFHPEFEIVFISSGSGKRRIGSHISDFSNGDLIFLGPNLPHLSFTDEVYEPHTEVVVQMKADFLGDTFFSRPELKMINQLFNRAKTGLTFKKETKRAVGNLLMQLPELDNFDRLIYLLKVLQRLALSSEVENLDIDGFGIQTNPRDGERINAIYEYVDKNFRDTIHLDAAAALVNMTVPSFCRYFKKLTNKTFLQFVNEYRISYACRLLTQNHESIAEIAFECGFNNLSHFNKQFKRVTGKSPSVYRLESF